MDDDNIKVGLPPFSALTRSLSGPRSKAWEVTDRATQMELDGRKMIHLGVGDPDFDTPAGIVESAVRSLKNSRTHYSPIAGEPELRDAIADTRTNQYGIAVDSSQVTVFPGAQCALFATLLCLSGPGDEVILLEPFYATYEGVARAGGADVVTVPLPAGSHFDLDVDRIAAAITDRTRVILANSPGNPSGAVFGEQNWESLVELCRERKIWLVSDEVYSKLTFGNRHCSPLSLPQAQQNVVVVDSISKSHAMTGWRLGWTIAPPVLAAHLGNLAQCLLFGVSQFTQDAAAFALRESDDDVARMRDAFHSRRDVLFDALQKIDGLVAHRPAGGMFMMVDVSALGCDGEQFANGLLDFGGVAVVPGFAFGDSVTGFVRIGFLHDEQVLMQAAGIIGDYVSELAR